MKPVLWLVGLSGSGKSSLASLLRLSLEARGIAVEHLDGAILRRQLGIEGFGRAPRLRLGDALREAAMQIQAQGKVCIVSWATPFAGMRRKNRRQIPLYREIWVRCSLESLVARDPKGLYALAEAGKLSQLCGVDECFDEPLFCDAIIDTDRLSLAQSYEALCAVADEALESAADWACVKKELALPPTLLPLELPMLCEAQAQGL